MDEEEAKEENKEEIKEENEEHSQKKIVTSVVVEKVDENDEKEKELLGKDADVDISPLVRRKPESPLDPDTEKCADSGEKIAAVATETVVASERIEAAVQFAKSPDKSFENKSEEILEEKEAIVQNPVETENADEGVIDSDVREDVSDQVLEEISHSHQEQQSNEEEVAAEDRCQVDINLVPAEVSEDNEVVNKEEEKESPAEGCSLERSEVIEEARTFDATESEGSTGEGEEDCSQEACLVHQPEIVTDAEEEEPAPVGKGLSTEKSHVPDDESQESEESVPNEIVEELIENAIHSARPTIATDPEPSKSADNFPLEENLGGWDEEDTWEDYDSEFDLEDCRQSRIPAYEEFEIGVWSSALWTSDMKWEKPVVVEAEEVVGWGMPFDHLTNTSSNGTWSSSSSSGDEGARKDTFDESDFCDSPVNGADDSVSTDEGIVASDDEVSEKAVSEKIKKVIVDETSPAVVNTV